MTGAGRALLGFVDVAFHQHDHNRLHNGRAAESLTSGINVVVKDINDIAEHTFVSHTVNAFGDMLYHFIIKLAGDGLGPLLPLFSGIFHSRVFFEVLSRKDNTAAPPF